MANDASNHPQNSSDADMTGDHAESDAVQLAQADTPQQQPQEPQKTAAIPAVPNGTVHVELPQGENVVRVAVANGETVILPAPFDDQAALAAKEGNGNLAIKVGDITVILEGYQQTLNNADNPVVLKDEQGDTIDVAIVLASTDPNLDITTAAGPAAGAQGADNTGALLSQFANGAGLGGFTGVGVLDQTELNYGLIDNSLLRARNSLEELPDNPVTVTPPPPPGPGDNPLNFVSKGTAVDEGALPIGSHAASPDEVTKGTVHIEAKDGVQTITIGGTPIDLNNPTATTVTGTFGKLEITGWDPTTGDLTYTYTLTKNDPNHPSQGVDSKLDETFPITATDKDGDTDTGDLEIVIIDDVPVARPDTDLVTKGTSTTDGNVIDGTGTTSLGAGVDTKGADGAQVTGVSGQTTDNDAKGGFTVDGQYGKLVMAADGTYTYTRNAGTPGGVTDNFKYTLTDGDGDTSTTTLKIEIEDSKIEIKDLTPEAQGGDVKVDEDDLATRSGEPAGSDGKQSTTQAGDFSVTAPDGLQSLTVGGKDVVTNGVFTATSFTTPQGNTLSITGYDAATGKFTYTYTLLDNEAHGAANGENSLFENLTVVATDKDGDTANDTLSVNIVDDVPTARNDSDTLLKGEATASGNVISGDSTTGGLNGAGADTKGADDAQVTGVAGKTTDNNAAGGFTVYGQYGKLVMAADGSYTYTRTPGTPGGVSDTFKYTLTDGDGDTSQATLTVNIENNKIEIKDLTPEAQGGDVKVDEDDLATRNGEPAGSDGKQSTTQGGDFSVTAPDGLQSLTVGGKDVVTNGVFTATSFTTPQGNTLSITGYDAATGKFTYTYTLLDNEAHGAANGENSLFENLTVVATDKDGDTANDTLSVNIVDDVPTARNDSDTVLKGETTASGNVISGDGTLGGLNGSGSDTKGADDAQVTGVAGKTTDNNAAGGFTVDGTYGKLVMAADGTYTYTRNAGTPGGVSDSFKYTLTDGDGDTTQATLTVNIENNKIEIKDLTPEAQGGDVKVDEDDLATRNGEPAGSDGKQSTTQAGDFSVTAPDGLNTLNIDGHKIVENGVFTATSFTTPQGNTLSVTGYDSATGKFTYTYTLVDNEAHVSANGENSLFENLTVIATDKDGDTASDTLSVNIVDDVPTARNDSDTLLKGEATASGNVISGDGTLGGLNGSGSDTKGADDAQVTGVAGKTTDNNAAGGFTVDGTYGKLVMAADGTYTYTRNAGTPGGVSDSFKYTLTDGDGDTSQATLTVNIENNKIEIKDLTPEAQGGDVKVDEDDLATRNGEPAGSDGKQSTTQAGDFSVTAPDGLQSLTVGGKDVVTNGVFTATSFTTPQGNTLSITGYDAATGKFTYTYTLLDNEAHGAANGENSLFENLTVVATDKDGDTANDTLSVNIVDDVPTARNDSDTVAKDNPVATGNVITGESTSGGLNGAGADTKGADDAQVTGVAGKTTDNNAAGGFTVYGQYGKLVMAADGSYTYTRTPGTPGGVSDTFKYTLTDGDGDTSQATLTVNIENNKIEIKDLTPEAQGGDVKVDEDDLGSRGAGESVGSDGKQSTTQGGDFSVTAPDGLQTLTVGGKDVVTNGVFTATSFTTPLGNTLSITGYDAATGKFTYTYTLLDNETHGAANGENSLFENLTVVATDKDGDTANDTLSVNIVDDVPTANADTDAVGNKLTTDGNVITGVGTTSGAAGIDVKGADGASVSGVSGKTTDNDAAGGFTVDGTYGKLVVDAAGNYTYTRFNDVPLHAVDTFTYTLKDGDGDTSQTTLKVSIDDDGCNITNLTPSANGGDATVDEGGLLATRGAGESAGSDGVGSTKGNGDFTISAPDGVDSLSVGGHAVITNGTFAATTFTTALGNTMSITGYDAGTGKITYNYTLNDNETHSGKGQDSIYEDLTVSLKDKDGDTAGGTLSVNIVDDVPLATGGAQVTGGGDKTNVLLIMDISGSMADNSGVANPNGGGNLTRLQLEGQTIINILNAYAAAGETMVQIATFSTDAQVPNAAGGWMSVQEAITLVNQIVQQGPQQQTDYHDAIVAGQQAFNTDGKIVGADNVAYFFSDGAPNQGANGGPLGGTETQNWENFLNQNDIKTYAIGLGTGTNPATLNPVAYDGTGPGTQMDANIVTNLNQLAGVISATLPTPATGKLAGVFGADGGHVASIVIDGKTYTYEQAVAANADHKLTIAAGGGSLVIDMDDGKYTYAPDFSKGQKNLDIGFTLIDNEGDTASAHQYLLAPLPAFMIPSEPTPTTTRDAYGDGNYNVPTGKDSADHIRDWTSGGNENDVHNSTIDGGKGSDWIEAGAGNDTVIGNAGTDKILGGAGNDNLQGGTADDWLDGGSGNDWLQGGNHNDVMIGGSGSDKMDGGSGTDYFLNVDSADLDGTNLLADGKHSINGGTGSDYVDLSGIANFGSAQAARIQNVEELSFVGGGKNTVTLSADDVFGMTEANGNHNLVIKGDAGSDTASLTGGGWTQIGANIAANDGGTYNVFQHGAGANQVTVFVDHNVATATA